MTDHIDQLDRRLLVLLREDGRASVTTLAARLGVARGTVQTRMARLQATGVLRRFTVEVDEAALSDRVRAIMLIELQGAMGRQVIRAIARQSGIVALHSTNGAWDLVAELDVDTLAGFDQLLRAIREIPGVLNSETCLLLDRATH